MKVLIAGVLILGALVFGALSGLWWAWWLYPSWNWFVVPLGLPQISLWHFWALYLILRIRPAELSKTANGPTSTGNDYIAWFLSLLLGPMVVWTTMYFLHKGVSGV